MNPPKRRSVGDTSGLRLNVNVSLSASQRLHVHCVMWRLSPGQVIEALIEQHLKDFRVQQINSGSVKTEDRSESSEGVSDPVADAA
jgi:hypothetical protein